MLAKESKDGVVREKLGRASMQVVSFMAEHGMESRIVVSGMHSPTRPFATAAVGVLDSQKVDLNPISSPISTASPACAAGHCYDRKMWVRS